VPVPNHKKEDEMADANKAAEELRADMDKLKSDMSALMDTIGKIAEESKKEGKRRVREAGEMAAVHAEESMHAVEAQIAERPFISVLAAFGVGMVIGRLLDRR
jgi:ElaB/YqjD/DUF883 family membrane-anchored ribosome-binding protein